MSQPPEGPAEGTPHAPPDASAADPGADSRSLLTSTAVMAAGTVVSRLSGFVRGILLAAALGVGPARRRVQHRQHRPEHALHPAGRRRHERRAGAAAGARDEERPGRRGGLHQPDHDPRRAVPRARDGAARRRGSAADAAVPRPGVLHPCPGGAARVGDRLRALLPAAGVLLRDVRAGRPGAQLPRSLRTDDVGADREQRGGGGGARDVPAHPRPGRGGRRRAEGSPPAPRRCSASARRSASSCSSSCWCPT